VTLPETPFYWYCGALCFNSQANYALDDKYRQPDFAAHLDEALARLQEDRAQGVQLASLFGHPHKTICEEFADVSFYAGRNALHEDLRPPRPMPEEDRARAKAHIELLFQRMSRLTGFEVVTVADLTKRYGQRPNSIATSRLRQFATNVLDAGAPVYVEGLSAAEGLLGLAEALVWERGRGGKLRAVPLRSVLGPLEVPPERPPLNAMDRGAVVDLARDLLRVTESTGHLPSSLPGTGIGLGSALLLLAEAFTARRSAPSAMVPRETLPWPAVAEAMAEPIGKMPGWPCHDPDMDVSRILRYCRLMSWTLAPASKGE
jgi:hypothetical protein